MCGNLANSNMRETSRGFSNLVSLSTEEKDLIKKNEVQLNWKQYFTTGCSSGRHRHFKILKKDITKLETR